MQTDLSLRQTHASRYIFSRGSYLSVFYFQGWVTTIRTKTTEKQLANRYVPITHNSNVPITLRYWIVQPNLGLPYRYTFRSLHFVRLTQWCPVSDRTHELQMTWIAKSWISISIVSWGLLCSYTHLYCHYENTPILIYCKFHLQKTENFQMKNWYFSYFCSKHRL